MTITTTVSWADLIGHAQDELDEYRDAYDELDAQLTAEYGEDARDRTLPQDPDLLSEDERDLWVYRTQMSQYDEAAKSSQQRIHVLERCREEYGDGTFEIRMLTGSETVEIETEMRAEANRRDVTLDVVQSQMYTRTVDRATVDAPEGVPREDGDPVPSECPNALTLALWEQVNAFNTAGATDFQAGGLGDDDPAPASTPATSATPEPSAPSPTGTDE